MLQTIDNAYVNTTTTWINITFTTTGAFSFFAIIYFALLLALNRFVALILPKYNAFFESTKLYFLIAFVWLLLIVMQTADIYYCKRKFDVGRLSWIADCARSNGVGELWWRMRYISVLILLNAMFVLYIIIFCSIHRKRQRITKMNAERNKNQVEISHLIAFDLLNLLIKAYISAKY
ncbi:Serpentine type 7TM GPCR chemoreceptor Srx family protein [Acanthocheilonema viteae]